MSPVRAVGLLSGGLDSALAARLLLDQGVEVIGLHLESPTACRADVRALARELGIRLEVRPKGDEYLKVLREPRFGYGRHMNPCADCRVFMFRRGRDYLDEFAAAFLFTGEVVGQRPMSQRRDRMDLIDRESGLEGRVLRPLSARLLPETLPERDGLVDRTRLLAISGRARHEQLALAKRYGLAHYSAPGGGCLLTDAAFSARLRDLLDHRPDAGMADVRLLTVGRHHRLGPAATVALGRDAGENATLLGHRAAGRWTLETEDFAGPAALVSGPRDPATLARVAGLIAGHARGAAPGRRLVWRDGDDSGTFVIERWPEATTLPIGAGVEGREPEPPAARNPRSTVVFERGEAVPQASLPGANPR